MNHLERMREAQRAARERDAALTAENAYWAVKADEVRRQEAERKAAEKRGRDELVQHLLNPQNFGAMVMARATISAPLIAADGKLPAKFCWMPEGTHEISAGNAAGGSWQGTVICDEIGAKAVEASFAQLTREGWRSFIDFDHAESQAAAWVHGFSWQRGVGIVCAVEWTAAGEEAIRGRIFTSFSPSFFISESGRVSGLRTNAAAGALTNRPAFGLAMPPISAGARSVSANLIRDTMLANGSSSDEADRVADAVNAGHDPRAIALLIQTLSSQRG